MPKWSRVRFKRPRGWKRPKFGTGIRRLGYKLQSVPRTVRTVIQRMAEKKMAVMGGSGNLLQNYSGPGTQFSPMLGNALQCSQGQTQYTRLGDQIQAMYLDVALALLPLPSHSNTCYRVIVLSGEQQDLGSGLDWRLNGVGACLLTASINTDFCSIKYDKTINAPCQTDGAEAGVFTYKFRIPLNKKLVYKTDAGNAPGNANYYNLYVVAYNASVANGTIIGQYDFNAKLVFTDV